MTRETLAYNDMKEKGLDQAESFGKAWYSCIASKEILHLGARGVYDDERASLCPTKVELILVLFSARANLNRCYRFTRMCPIPSKFG